MTKERKFVRQAQGRSLPACCLEICEVWSVPIVLCKSCHLTTAITCLGAEDGKESGSFDEIRSRHVAVWKRVRLELVCSFSAPANQAREVERFDRQHLSS